MLTNKFDICIVGSGVAGALVAAFFAKAGEKVVLIEAGKTFAFENRLIQLQEHLYLGKPKWPWEFANRDVYEDSSSQSLNKSYKLNANRVKAVGGSTLHWGGMAQRFYPSDFSTYSNYGYGIDWPISYNDLEPYYGLAEKELGVSGKVNKSDAPRSTPYPMDGFPHSYDDTTWYEAAKKLGLQLDNVSHARNSTGYRGRSKCLAYATCNLCPSGAKYSADIHVKEAIATGNCEMMSETVARRILTDENGDVDHIMVTDINTGKNQKIIADKYVIAAHAIETARLLMLSNIGNESGELGKNLMEHWYAGAVGVSKEQLYPHKIGFSTMECNNYYDGDERKVRGAIKLEFENTGLNILKDGWRKKLYGSELNDYDCKNFGRIVGVGAEIEHAPNNSSRVTMSQHKTDMFGDPAPHINFHLTDFDKRTHERAHEIIKTLLEARGLSEIRRTANYVQAAHHMGTCRMNDDPLKGVVDAQCKLHGSSNLYVSGSAVFPTGGARQPTLTIAALAIRLAKNILQNS